MNDQTPDKSAPQWIEAVQKRGFSPALRWLLEAFEPLAPLLSQLLWVAQPAAGIFGARQWIADLAGVLDSPEELAALRKLLQTQGDSGRAPERPDYTEQESGQAD